MIKKAIPGDEYILAQMARKVWDNNNIKDLELEFKEIIKSDKEASFIKYIGYKPVGFSNISLRYDYVEGTETSPVGYIEGIYVCEEYRRKGYARKLVKKGEDWARQVGAREFASDCIFENTTSIAFHKALGFEVANKIVCFRKGL